MKERINGEDFKRMVLSAAAAIEKKRQIINELNVFPVPDGDTGTNMSLTINTAALELNKRGFARVDECAEVVASCLLRGARGNSGVILSLLFRGFARGLKGLEEMDGAQFSAALNEGVDVAYKAVMRPAEGTILTVSRVCASLCAILAEENPGLEHVLSEAVGIANRALKETTAQNPVLKKANVVDAGGMGFAVILQGMLDAVRGKDASPDFEPDTAAKQAADFTEYTAEDITFAYCTEFIVDRGNVKADANNLRAFLNDLGDSLVLVDDDQIIKVHVHTNNPGLALEEALKYGMLSTVKIENMRDQHTEKIVEHQSQPQRQIVPAERRYGFVSVCSGEGICAVFKDLGVDNLISGGQTMNPSTEDILNQIDRTPAEVVFVLPNNKNIILAAEQCVPLSDKRVIVLPTKTIPQGICAMLAFEPSLDIAENEAAMKDALGRVRTGDITYAARDSEFDGMEIKQGEYLCLLEGHLFGSGQDLMALAAQLAEKLSDSSFITIFYGEGVTEEQANKLRAVFEERCPDAEVNVLYGGQAVYYYLISAE